MKKIAVVLCGSGSKDGSEVRESVAVLWALSQHPVEVQCFAPEGEQADVVNHLTEKSVPGESRNMLLESARIARGKVRPLTELRAQDIDGLILPGGFGAAKNLCNFALRLSQGLVCAELHAVLEPMKKAKKPIGAICISPAILALAFRGEGIEMTLGQESELSQEIEKIGHKHVVRAADEIHVDPVHRVVTTPAYMCGDVPLHQIFNGIQKLVAEVIRLT